MEGTGDLTLGDYRGLIIICYYLVEVRPIFISISCWQLLVVVKGLAFGESCWGRIGAVEGEYFIIKGLQ
jgi:hypothetical protein